MKSCSIFTFIFLTFPQRHVPAGEAAQLPQQPPAERPVGPRRGASPPLQPPAPGQRRQAIPGRQRRPTEQRRQGGGDGHLLGEPAPEEDAQVRLQGVREGVHEELAPQGPQADAYR